VNDDANPGIFAAHFGDLFRREALVHGTIALPQNDTRFGHGFRRIPAKIFERIPDDHFVQRNSHAVGVLRPRCSSGKTKLFSPRAKAHFITAGALELVHATAVFAGEGLNRGGGIHIGDRNNLAGVGHAAQFIPACFDLANIAISAMEQPALKSGKTTTWLPRRRMSALSP